MERTYSRSGITYRLNSHIPRSLVSMLGRRQRKPRRFDYEPRFYDQEKDEKIKERMRIKSQSRSRHRRNAPGLIYFFLLLFLVIFIYQSL